MHAGEQTLLVTRPTRLIALRFWSAMLLALILAGVFGFHIPRFFGSTALNYTVVGIDFGLILKKEMDALKVECQIAAGWPAKPECTGPDKSELEFLLRHFGMNP